MYFTKITENGRSKFPFRTAEEIEKFINDAINEKVERDGGEIKGLCVYPKKIKIIAEDGEYLKAVYTTFFNVFCQERKPYV